MPTRTVTHPVHRVAAPHHCRHCALPPKEDCRSERRCHHQGRHPRPRRNGASAFALSDFSKRLAARTLYDPAGARPDN